jgi:hypothetical protein
MAGKMPPQFMKGGKSPAKPNPFAAKGAAPAGGKAGAKPNPFADKGAAPAFKKGGKVGMKGKC